MDKPAPIYANAVGYNATGSELNLEFGFRSELDGLNAQAVVYSRVSLPADLIEPLLQALEALKKARDEQRAKAAIVKGSQ